MEGVPYHGDIYGQMAVKCLNAHPEGCTVHMDALRNGAPIKFEVAVKPAFSPAAAQDLQARAAALAAQIDSGHPAPATHTSPPQGGVKLGIRVRAATDEDAHAALLAETRGIFVQSVDAGGLADSIKLQASDILLEIDGVKIVSMDDFRKRLATPFSTLTIWRAGASIKLQVPESF